MGTGAAFVELVRRNLTGKNIGIDLSPKMLAKAKKRLQAFSDNSYSLDIGSAFALPVESGSIDLLMNNYMFDLIADQPCRTSPWAGHTWKLPPNIQAEASSLHKLSLSGKGQVP